MRLGTRRLWLGIGLGLVGLASLIVWTPWPTQLLQAPLVQSEPARPSDVIIVLGAGTRSQPLRLPPQAMDRLRMGKVLWGQKLAEQMIVAGGFTRRTPDPESKFMKPFLVSLGVPEANIIEENQSLDTYQNAVNSREIMRQHDWETALVVTSSYHTWRGCRIFRQLEVEVTCVAAPLDDHGSVYERWINFRSVVREYGAIIYYAFRGYI